MLLPKTVQFSVKSLLILVGCAAVVFGIVHHEFTSVCYKLGVTQSKRG